MLNLDEIRPREIPFTLGGREYSIPTIDALDADTAIDFIGRKDVEGADYLGLFRSVVERHAPGALESLTVAQMRALLADWQRSGNAGESSTSSV